MDVYHPNKRQQLSKIIIFIYGGSWNSGSKFMYATMANTLRELGYIVIVPDYRKYPEVKIDEMYKDIRESIKWTFKHAADINGDPEQIFVMVRFIFYYLVKIVMFVYKNNRVTVLEHS